ncbi:MAG: hypothetical protein JO013_00405 [Alphaproteobacteria bacterium]|nr:hypothetical protein [Alphaproteobacteria bacterium]
MILAALLLQSYVHRVPQVTPVARFGAIAVEREDPVATGQAVLHEMPLLPKARLVWSSADGLVRALYEDDGLWLNHGVMIRRKPGAGPDVDCSMWDGSTLYGARAGGAEAWREGIVALRRQLAQCGGIDAERAAGYEREYRAAAPQAAAAGKALRSLARTMFGGLRRCAAAKTRYGPAWDVRCARREGPD